jgi:NADH-quinone oxidoreductase subunit E
VEAGIDPFEDEVTQIATRWRNTPGMVTGALQELQERCGYLPEEGLKELARGLGLPLSRLFGVATFFSFFRFSPPGKHHLQVCMGTACHVLGAEQISRKLSEDLKVDREGVTEDRQFSLERVRCLGCCSLAPVVRINDDTYGRVRLQHITRLLKTYRQPEASRAHQE